MFSVRRSKGPLGGDFYERVSLPSRKSSLPKGTRFAESRVRALLCDGSDKVCEYLEGQMPTPRIVTLILVTALFVTVGLSRHADAYIDLGTGSYLLQLVFAGLFGMIFSARSLWEKVRAVFAGSSRRARQ